MICNRTFTDLDSFEVTDWHQDAGKPESFFRGVLLCFALNAAS
jgi:hypothetical protein